MISCFKNFFYHTRLVNEADDAHLALAFGTNKRVCFINGMPESTVANPASYIRQGDTIVPNPNRC
jgi:hypothetical protein